jgi:hypothetical protein
MQRGLGLVDRQHRQWGRTSSATICAQMQPSSLHPKTEVVGGRQAAPTSPLTRLLRSERGSARYAGYRDTRARRAPTAPRVRRNQGKKPNVRTVGCPATARRVVSAKINHTYLIKMVPNLKSTTNIAYWLHGISSCNR